MDIENLVLETLSLELWFIILGFYFFEMQRGRAVTKYLEQLCFYCDRMLLVSRVGGSYNATKTNLSLVSKAASNTWHPRKHLLYKMQNNEDQSALFSSYLKSLYRSGTDYEKVFSCDLASFILLLKIHLSIYEFMKQALRSHGIIALLLCILNVLFASEKWNFQSMIVVMFCLQFMYMFWSKKRIYQALKEDFYGEDSFQTEHKETKHHPWHKDALQKLKKLWQPKKTLQEFHQHYWDQKGHQHSFYHEVESHQDVAMVSKIFLRENALRQDFSFFHVLQAVALVGALLVENFF